MSELTLTETLMARGLEHRPTERSLVTQAHDVVDKEGTVLFTGTANDVWRWLHEEGQR